MYTELRREVLRCQRGGAEAFERNERAGRDVRIMGRELRTWRTAETSCRRPVYLYDLRASDRARVYKSKSGYRHWIDGICTIYATASGIRKALASTA